MQAFQKNVIRTAGAGDSFNGGYVSASLGFLNLKERLVVANAATAFFVTHATAPTKLELIEQIGKGGGPLSLKQEWPCLGLVDGGEPLPKRWRTWPTSSPPIGRQPSGDQEQSENPPTLSSEIPAECSAQSGLGRPAVGLPRINSRAKHFPRSVVRT